ncbi:hypothetical protein ACX93W_17665 [Paenibacillus sp. CAU 1782]
MKWIREMAEIGEILFWQESAGYRQGNKSGKKKAEEKAKSQPTITIHYTSAARSI